MLKKIIDRLRNRSVEAELQSAYNSRQIFRGELSFFYPQNFEVQDKAWAMIFLRDYDTDLAFQRRNPRWRERDLTTMMTGIVNREGWVGNIRAANIRLAHLFKLHTESLSAEQTQAEGRSSAISTAIIRMLEIDKDNLLEEQAMFTESEWKARAKAIDDGEIDIETLRHNELEASVAVPYTGEEDLKGLPYDVLQEMLAEYRRKAMIVGHMQAHYRHEDYTVFISKDGIQVEHENVVAFNGAA